MEQKDDENNILKEKDFILKSDKKIEYRLKLFISNNDLLCINLYTIKIVPSKKYSLSLTMDDLIKNRFFKIFINLEEVFRELENKIDKSTIIEDSGLILLDIPIGLNIFTDIILEIEEAKKSCEEIIQEYKNELNNKDIKINELQFKIYELENKIKGKKKKLNNKIKRNELIKSLRIIIEEIERKRKERESDLLRVGLRRWKRKVEVNNVVENGNEISKYIEKRYRISKSRNKWQKISRLLDLFETNKLMFVILKKIKQYVTLEKFIYTLERLQKEKTFNNLLDALRLKLLMINLCKLIECWDKTNQIFLIMHYLRLWNVKAKKIKERDDAFEDALDIINNKRIKDATEKLLKVIIEKNNNIENKNLNIYNNYNYSVKYYLTKINESKNEIKKKQIKTKIKIKNDGEIDWPKNCVLCCIQNINEVNNYYFKDFTINDGKEVKKGKEIKIDVLIFAKDKFNLFCEENYFFINYDIKVKGVYPLNKEKTGTILIEYN